MDRFVRMAELKSRVGLSTSTIYRLIANGQFPRPAQIAPGSVGWYASEIESWMQERQRTS